MSKFDLEKYLKRINYAGDRSVSLQVLDQVTEAHAKSIPFENVDVMLNKNINLSREGIFDKLVTRQRGGYCFEQNGLLLMALESMGFDVKPLSARVRLRFTSREPMAPRTHMFLQVDIGNESYLTDVGMGSGSLTKALALLPNVVQETPHDSRRIVMENKRWYHQILYGQTWQDACEFTLEEMPAIDQEIANWFTSTHPQSHFRDRVVASRALDGGERLNLQNYELTIRPQSGEARKTALKDNQELIEVLSSRFGLALTDSDRAVLSTLKLN